MEACERYTFRYGRNPLMEWPLAFNPSGSARSEPKACQTKRYRDQNTGFIQTVQLEVELHIMSSSFVSLCLSQTEPADQCRPPVSGHCRLHRRPGSRRHLSLSGRGGGRCSSRSTLQVGPVSPHEGGVEDQCVPGSIWYPGEIDDHTLVT